MNSPSKTVNPLVFYFCFAPEEVANEMSEKTYGFLIENPLAFYNSLGGSQFKDIEDVLYEKVTEDIESSYGVHDWSTGPSTDVDAIGYASYEVEPRKELELMMLWRDRFISSGCVCSDVVKVDESAANLQDADIYADIMAKTKDGSPRAYPI